MGSDFTHDFCRERATITPTTFHESWRFSAPIEIMSHLFMCLTLGIYVWKCWPLALVHDKSKFSINIGERRSSLSLYLQLSATNSTDSVFLKSPCYFKKLKPCGLHKTSLPMSHNCLEWNFSGIKYTKVALSIFSFDTPLLNQCKILLFFKI